MPVSRSFSHRVMKRKKIQAKRAKSKPKRCLSGRKTFRVSCVACVFFVPAKPRPSSTRSPRPGPWLSRRTLHRLLGCTVCIETCMCFVCSLTRGTSREEAAKQQRRGGTGRQPPCGAIRAGPKWMASRTRIHAEVFAQEALLSRRASFLVRSKLFCPLPLSAHEETGPPSKIAKTKPASECSLASNS